MYFIVKFIKFLELELEFTKIYKYIIKLNFI